MIRSVLTYLLLLSSLAVAQAKRPFTFEDMMALKRVGDPIVSPDGNWIVFPVHVNLEANSKTPHLWLIPANGGEAKQLTDGPGEDSPRWSPDSKEILYLRSRSARSRFGFRLSMPPPATNRRAAQGDVDLNRRRWRSSGRPTARTSSSPPRYLPIAPMTPAIISAKKSVPKRKAQIFTHLLYRHWTTFEYGKRTHLFVVPADGGTAHDLTPGDHDVPPFSLGGQTLYAISPDGQEVAYTSNIDEVHGRQHE